MKREKSLKSLKSLLTVLLFCAAAVFFCPGGQVSAAAGVKKLSMGAQYQSFDITGDRKNDTVKFTGSKEYDRYQRIRIYVNGKQAASIKLSYVYSIDLELITLSNGKPFLFLSGSGDNGDGERLILQYKNKKLKKIIDVDSLWSKYGGHPYATVQSVKGNKVVLRQSLMSYSLGAGLQCDFTYKYQGGTLKRDGNTAKIIRLSCLEYSGKKCYTAQKSIPVYKNAGSTAKKSFTIKKGQGVYATAVWVKGKKMWIKVRVNGKTGWIPASKKYYLDSQKPFKEIMYAG